MDKVKNIQANWKDKYPKMDFKIQNLRFDDPVNFNFTFTGELEGLNMDGK
jgi:hypothetical protein